MLGLNVFLDWLTMKDYENAKDKGTVDIVTRLTRGNTLSQNGDVLTESELALMSHKADADMVRLEKSTSR